MVCLFFQKRNFVVFFLFQISTQLLYYIYYIKYFRLFKFVSCIGSNTKSLQPHVAFVQQTNTMLLQGRKSLLYPLLFLPMQSWYSKRVKATLFEGLLEVLLSLSNFFVGEKLSTIGFYRAIHLVLSYDALLTPATILWLDCPYCGICQYLQIMYVVLTMGLR